MTSELTRAFQVFTHITSIKLQKQQNSNIKSNQNELIFTVQAGSKCWRQQVLATHWYVWNSCFLAFFFLVQRKSLFYLINIWACNSISCESFRAGPTLKSLCCLHAPHSSEAGINFTFRFSTPRKLSWKTHSAQTFNAERTVSIVEKNIHHGSQLASILKKSPRHFMSLHCASASCAVPEKTSWWEWPRNLLCPQQGEIEAIFLGPCASPGYIWESSS